MYKRCEVKNTIYLPSLCQMHVHVHVHVHSQSTMHEQISCNINWEEEVQYDQKRKLYKSC